MATVFFSYSHVDEQLRDQLEKHLSMLKRQGIIKTWHDRRIPAGDALDSSIDKRLDEADVILLLVSPDFLASTYCYDVEMQRAMERHRAGEARVIPIILRYCDWHAAPFGQLIATPRDAKPIRSFPDIDEGYLQVVQAIREALSNAQPKPIPRIPARLVDPTPQRLGAGPRSSNLRIKRTFKDADKDQFRDDAFKFIARFFENSTAELEARYPIIEGRFKQIQTQQFTASLYREGTKCAFCRIFMGDGSFSRGIAYSSNDTMGTSSFNESLSVEADDDALFLRSLHSGRDKRLTFEGAAELYWAMFIESLRR
jgi:hypothetical protein